MTTATDPFLSILDKTIIQYENKANRKLLPHERAMLKHDGHVAALDDYGKAGGAVTRLPVTYHPEAKPKPGMPGARPDYADDIDRIVTAMVRAGDVVWDTETDQYRKPYYRRFRFGNV